MKQKRERVPEPPESERWQVDDLSKFMAQGEFFARMVCDSYPPMWDALVETYDVFDDLTGNLDDAEPRTCKLFLCRSYAAYLAGLRLLVATQGIECAPLLRSTLEYMIYAYAFRTDAARLEAWQARHESPESREVAKKKTHLKDLIKPLKKDLPEVGFRVEELYDRTIDWGAHPNPLAVMAGHTVEFLEDEESVMDWVDTFLGDDNPHFFVAVETALDVGLFSILTGSAVFPELAQKAGVLDRITGLEQRIESQRPELRNETVRLFLKAGWR